MVRADVVRAADLQALKTDMIRSRKYHPRTINHDISSIKSLFLWASGMEIIPPVNFRFVKSEPLPPTPNKAMKPKKVWEMLEKAPPSLRCWLAVNYLTMARPSEMVRVVNRQGEWEEKWLFRCHGKVTGRTQEWRRIVFSTEALAWLKFCEPRWKRQDTYYQACERACGRGGPHPLRHSGATHLSERGVARRDIDLLLGHLPSRVSRTYVRIDWQSLRRIATHLTLRPSLKPPREAGDR